MGTQPMPTPATGGGLSRLPLGAGGGFLRLLAKLPTVLRYYTIIGLIFIFKNAFTIVSTLKAETAASSSLVGKIVLAVLAIFKFFAKKAIVFDVGIYEATQKLQSGTLPFLEHLNVLTDVLLGFAVFMITVYAIIRIDAFFHNEVVGFGSILVGVLLLYFMTGYFGVKWTGDINYEPFRGMLEFFKLVWSNPEVLKPSLQYGLW